MTLKDKTIPAYLQRGREAIKRVAPNLNSYQLSQTKSIASLVDSAEIKVKKAKRLLAS